MGKSDRIQRKHDDEREKLTAKLGEQSEQKKKTRIVGKTVLIVCAVILILALTWAIMAGSGLLQRGINAVKIGDADITAAEYNYYYLTTIQNFQNTYGDYISYFGLDFTLPLSSQKYSENMTWEQYFEEQGMNSLKNVVVMSEEAKRNNITLTETDKLQIDAFINSLISTAEDINAVLPKIFGKGTTVENLRTTRERYQLAQRYIMYKLSTFKVTDAEIDEHYNANKNTFDSVDYDSFVFPVASEGLDEAKTKALKDETLAKANDMLGRVKAGEKFGVLALEYAPEESKATYESEDATHSAGTAFSSVSDTVLSGWLFDAARKNGDAGVLETTGGYTVVLFGSRYRDEYITRSVRHILIPPKQDADGTVSDEAYVDAHDQAEKILEEFKASGSSLEKFATLCATYSNDTATAADGGLFENVYKGQMVPEFEAWVYDAARKPGDTEVIKTDYGYHVMYYIGENIASWKAIVKSDLIDSRLTAEYDELDKAYEVVTNSLGMSITK